jgi:allantoinase
MTFDLVVRAGNLEVGVQDGVVAALGRDLPGGREEVREPELELLPGAVDAHVHLNDPGRAEWEGFETGTAAMAAGGTTCFVDMPLNAHPPTVDGAAFDAKVAAAHGRALVDFALWGGLVPGDVDRLDELAERGVVGFKAFMCPTGIDDFDMADDETLRAGMARAARLGLPVAVHAEDPGLTGRLTAAALAEGRSGARAFLESRPVEAETLAIARGLELARETGCSLHVVHVSSGSGVRLVSEARAAGVDVTCETCPHYLVLGEEDLERLGAVAKCAPPLRGKAERDELWRRLRAGEVALVGSDHSPAPPHMKEGDVMTAWGGISGCQLLLPLMLTTGLAVEEVVRLVSHAPARRFRLPGKGRLEVGADADLVLVDRRSSYRLTERDLRTRHRISPYVGRELRARVVRTWVRGALVGTRAGQLVRPG